MCSLLFCGSYMTGKRFRETFTNIQENQGNHENCCEKQLKIENQNCLKSTEREENGYLKSN